MKTSIIPENPKFRNLTTRGLLAHFFRAEAALWPAADLAEIAIELLRRGEPVEF